MYTKKELDMMSVKEKLAASEKTADEVFPLLFGKVKHPGERWREHIRLGVDDSGVYVVFTPTTPLGQEVCDLMIKEMREIGVGTEGTYRAEIV